MTKQERIESDKKLQQLYSELITSLNGTLTKITEIYDELDNNIQGRCAEKRMADSIIDGLTATAEWANIMQKEWEKSAEIDQEQ